jgi:SOS-response transcriptional repressor LexA
VTKRQSEMLEIIQAYIAEHKYSPTYRELQEATKLHSISGVARIVDALCVQGYIEKRVAMARSIRVLE